MKKKVILTILTMAIAFSMVLCGGMVVFAMGGSGTSADPYQIASLTDLNEMQAKIAAEEAGGAYAKAYYQLTANITDASGLTASIGATDKSFQGVFDGNGKTITGLTKPLFGVVDGESSVVKHLILSKCNIESDVTDLGALICSAEQTDIENCAVAGTVKSTAAGSVGGILGRAAKVTLKNSYFNGSVVGADAQKGVVIGTVPSGEPVDISNVYYIPISGVSNTVGSGTASGMTSKSAAEFKSGEVCHALQGTQNPVVWGQKLGTDATPVFVTASSPQVFQVEIVDLDSSNQSTMKYVNNGDKVTISAGAGYTVSAYEDADKKTAFDFGKTAITKDMKLYVTSTATKYTVTFNSNGGSAVASQSVESGKTATKPTDPTRSGYTFGGWYKETALTNAWDFTKDTVTANTTLYAKWTAAATTAAKSNVKAGDEGTPLALYILLGIGILGAAASGGVLLYRHSKFY